MPYTLPPYPLALLKDELIDHYHYTGRMKIEQNINEFYSVIAHIRDKIITLKEL